MTSQCGFVMTVGDISVNPIIHTVYIYIYTCTYIPYTCNIKIHIYIYPMDAKYIHTVIPEINAYLINANFASHFAGAFLKTTLI